MFSLHTSFRDKVQTLDLDHAISHLSAEEGIISSPSQIFSQRTMSQELDR
jgi:hypothetical protein